MFLVRPSRPRTLRATADGRLQTEDDWTVVPTVIRRGASLGSGAVILCGVTIGENALVGAGSVITKDVPAGKVVVGNPARVINDVQNLPYTVEKE